VNPKDMKKYCRKACKMCDGDKEEVPEEKSEECKDTHELCEFWAQSGECKKNPSFMEVGCAVSCGTCRKVISKQRSSDDSLILPKDVDREVAERIMEKSKSFGVRQIAAGADAKETLIKIEEAEQYMQDEKTLALPKNILENCANRHEMCSFWSAVGECENNRAYMTINCSPACKSCNLIDINARCPPLEDAEPALRPGDLQKVRSFPL
jgi:prolyl 4-hydroxylase